MTDLKSSNLSPSSFSPYFTLTYSWYISEARRKLGDPPIPVRPIVRQPKLKPPKFTVEEIFGHMRTMSDDGQAEFLLLLMKQVDVDWSVACKTAAKSRSIRPASQVTERLSRIAHKHAFKLLDGKKITEGSLLDKTPVTAPMAKPDSSKGPEAVKVLRKRRRPGPDTKPLVTKKKKARKGKSTIENQDTEQLAADPNRAE